MNIIGYEPYSAVPAKTHCKQWLYLEFLLSRLVLYDTVSNNVSKRLAKTTQSSVTPRPRYTFQRNSLYYFRYTLPPDISKVVGKQGLRYSLKTGYIKQAERKARRLAGTVEEFISDVRQERPVIMKLSETQIQSLLDQHLRQSLNEDEERHLSVGPINPDDLDDELEAISYIKSDFKEALALNDYEGISSHVDDLLIKSPSDCFSSPDSIQ